jgi:hypothetical protein
MHLCRNEKLDNHVPRSAREKSWSGASIRMIFDCGEDQRRNSRSGRTQRPKSRETSLGLCAIWRAARVHVRVCLRRLRASVLLSTLFKFLGLCHEIGSKPFKRVRGGQMRIAACAGEVNTHESALAKIFDDFRSHECVVASIEISERAVALTLECTALFTALAKARLAISGPSFAISLRDQSMTTRA